MIKKLALSFIIFHLSFSASAQSLTVINEAPGLLNKQLTDSVCFTLEELNIGGPLNSADLKLIQQIADRSKAKKGERLLTILDMRKARIVDDKKNTATNELPTSFLSGCEKLVELVLPDSLLTIGRNSLQGCSSLTDVKIPATVKVIDDNAFSKCSALEKIKLPADLIKIGKGAFRGCKALKSVTIPENVTTINSLFR